MISSQACLCGGCKQASADFHSQRSFFVWMLFLSAPFLFISSVLDQKMCCLFFHVEGVLFLQAWDQPVSSTVRARLSSMYVELDPTLIDRLTTIVNSLAVAVSTAPKDETSGNFLGVGLGMRNDPTASVVSCLPLWIQFTGAMEIQRMGWDLLWFD